MNTYKYAGIETYDINNGTGFGVTLFLQGCPHHCNGCHNPQTWDFNGGMPFTEGIVDDLRELFANPNIVRLTISGGEPLHAANANITYGISAMFKEMNPDKQLWIYTGYYLEDLLSDACYDGVNRGIFTLCDILVDGPFEIDKRDLSLPFRGSSNQRIIDMKETLRIGSLVIMQL